MQEKNSWKYPWRVSVLAKFLVKVKVKTFPLYLPFKQFFQRFCCCFYGRAALGDLQLKEHCFKKSFKKGISYSLYVDLIEFIEKLLWKTFGKHENE